MSFPSFSLSGSKSSVPRRLILAALPGLTFGTASEHTAVAGQALEPPLTLRGFEMLPPGISLPEIHLQDAEGGEAGADVLKGRPFLLNLWATWCAPCVEELPSLKRLSEAVGSEVRVILISQDRGGAAVAQPFLRRLGVDVPSFADPQGRLSRVLSARGLPTTFLGRSDGALLGRYEGGARWDRPEITSFIRSFLQQK